jgi:predicted permease
MAFAIGATLLTGFLCGLAPAFRLLRGAEPAHIQARTVTPMGPPRAFIAMEVALSLVLIAGAAMFLRGFQNLRSVPLGFSPEDVVVVTLSPAEELQKLKGHALFADRLLLSAAQLTDELTRHPDIQAGTTANFLAFNQGSIGYNVTAPEGEGSVQVTALRVDHRYFSTLKIAMRAGREFTPRDDSRAPRVMIINESLAAGLFGNRSPLGKIIRLGEQDNEIVGVVKDIKFGSIKIAAPPMVFLPISQMEEGGAFSGVAVLQLRTKLSHADAARLARDRIQAGFLPLVVESSGSLAEEIGASYEIDTIRTQATGAFGVLAIALIAIGIYGLMAYSVGQRTREIGVRVAVGSTSAGVVRMILHDTMRVVAAGTALGIPAALAAMWALRGMVFGLPDYDIVSLGAAAVLLVLAGLAAAALPAWRASRINPVEALRVQ